MTAIVGATLQLNKLAVLDGAGREFAQTSYGSKTAFLVPYALFKAACNLLVGGLADRHGRKSIALAGSLVGLVPPVMVLAASGVLFVMAVSLTSVANVVIIIATMPVFAAIFSRVFLGEPISRRMVLTMGVVMVGLCIVAYGTGENAVASRSGDALALLLTVSFAAALTAVRRVRSTNTVRCRRARLEIPGHVPTSFFAINERGATALRTGISSQET